MEMGLISLNQVMLDGTDIRANNSRHNTKRKASIQEKLAVLDQQIEQAMAQAQQAKGDIRVIHNYQKTDPLNDHNRLRPNTPNPRLRLPGLNHQCLFNPK